MLPLLALLPAAAPRKTMARACSNLAAPATAVIQPNGEMAGPNLSGLIGRKVGSDPTFDYSPALRKARDEGLGWDASRLDAFLAGPAKMFPGLWMSMRGIEDAAERQSLVRFLAKPSSR